MVRLRGLVACHSTPLHQAFAAGHWAMVRVLAERGARLDQRDTLFQGTPLGWATYLEKHDLAAYLQSRTERPGE